MSMLNPYKSMGSLWDQASCIIEVFRLEKKVVRIITNSHQGVLVEIFLKSKNSNPYRTLYFQNCCLNEQPKIFINCDFISNFSTASVQEMDHRCLYYQNI